MKRRTPIESPTESIESPIWEKGPDRPSPFVPYYPKALPEDNDRQHFPSYPSGIVHLPCYPEEGEPIAVPLPDYPRYGEPKFTLFSNASNTVPLPAPGPPPAPDPTPSYVPKPVQQNHSGSGMSTGCADLGLLQAQKANEQIFDRGTPDLGRLQAEQLSKKNLYGVNVDALLRMAESQLNKKEGPNNDNPYGIWYGNPPDQWCAQFASWCANQVGSLNTDPDNNNFGIPKNQSTAQFISDYKKMRRYAYGSKYTEPEGLEPYRPKAGDLFFLQTYDDKGELVGVSKKLGSIVGLLIFHIDLIE